MSLVASERVVLGGMFVVWGYVGLEGEGPGGGELGGRESVRV